MYTHQHHLIKQADKINTAKNQHQQIFTEKCQICDAMHHTSMDVVHNNYAVHLTAAPYVYHTGDFDFLSFALIQSDGLSPPVA
ncbi:hypothetical protein GCM10023149_46780 [Mucilaginibacter gynuensis]|uniref:Uncharacterized protein n=1 Tax=Mucilaginibacter gynuensis TaxID=1302236 RepID=A0ABP8HCT8_9SPHI